LRNDPARMAVFLARGIGVTPSNLRETTLMTHDFKVGHHVEWKEARMRIAFSKISAIRPSPSNRDGLDP
jgi:hypothetical protein